MTASTATVTTTRVIRTSPNVHVLSANQTVSFQDLTCVLFFWGGGKPCTRSGLLCPDPGSAAVRFSFEICEY